jgi:eukaryotic-like serine/threonine-protein kinase
LDAETRQRYHRGMDRDRWRVLEPLLDRALDLSIEDRASWLRDLRLESPALADDLAALLSREEIADERGFLIEPVEVSLAGLVLGAYTLAHELGHGGMGSVWLARRTDGRFEGLAAVKLLNFARLGLGGQARFRREGSVLARLTHPGIARLLDAGVSPNGQPYLVLEYVDGKPIDAYADAGNLTTAQRLALVLQVLGAVGHAHANLIVHRDIKPSNIMVTADGTVKLLDFGIAKLLDAKGQTIDGSRVLTPEYAAPEQATGGAITTATDVYAIGVLLYVLLSGRHPTADGCDSPIEVLRALHERQPTMLPLGDLGTIVDTALRKDPRERYQTAAAFADDLRRYLDQEPISARRSSFAYRTRKFVQRHRAGVIAAAGTAGALVAATVFSVAQMQNAQRQRDAAVFASQRATAQIEFQTLVMSQMGDTPLTMRQIVDRARAVLEQQYAGGDPRILASILMQLSDRYGDLGDDKVRSALLARAESIATVDQLAEVRCRQADYLRTRYSEDEAWRIFVATESLLRAHPDPEAHAFCLAMRGSLLSEWTHGSAQAAADDVRRAIQIRDSLGERSDAFYIGLLSSLGGALGEAHHYREAIDAFHRAGAILDSTGRGTTMMAAVNEHDMAVSLTSLGETLEAERVFHDVLIRAGRTDPTGRLPSQPLIHYAQAAMSQGDLDSAIKYFALLDSQAAADTDRYWQGRALFGLAEAQLRRGAIDRARRTMARFLSLHAHPDLRNVDDEIPDYRVLDGRLSFVTGHRADARRHVADALRAAGYFDGKRMWIFRSSLILAGEISLAAGEPKDALRYAADARAVSSKDSLSDTANAFVGEARLVEAKALAAQGDTAGTRTTLSLALRELRAGAGPNHPRTREAEQLLAGVR